MLVNNLERKGKAIVNSDHQGVIMYALLWIYYKW